LLCRPGQIHNLADVLKTTLYVYISTVSVYADSISPGSDENGELVDTSILDGLDLNTIPIDGKTYGPLKLLCELAVKSRYPQYLIIRPTYVIGPHDYTMRFPKLVKMIKAGGVVNCPINGSENPLQYIDARDQARFVVDLIESGKCANKIYHTLINSSISFKALMETIVSTLQANDPSLMVTLQWIEIEHSTDNKSIYPLWYCDRLSSGIFQMNSSYAVSDGLICRPLSETILDTAAWLETLN
jgi:2'-hydroxyisoflavone reductase